MLPSSTVENYLKAIYQGQSALALPERLVPMGSVASALGVTPGTATTMVKALAESGLAEYEPYSGVRLTAAGEKLAGLVLRRHRLVELFLVQVMGMSWAEVHEEAEQLEHVVSERLIERMDQMLGHPTHDPHGDPIPNPEGTIMTRHLENLLTCPLGTLLKVTRVADQDPLFLRFIEKNDLKPGQSIEVEARDAAADSVLLRGQNRRPITIGTRAASKLLVEVALVFFSLAVATPVARAQQTTPPAEESLDPDRPDVTNGTHIVGTGQLQIEVGGQYAHMGVSERAFGSPFTARLGLTDWLEGRLGTDGLLSQANSDGQTTGVGNVQLGAKVRLWSDPGGVPVLSILPTVNLPTASAAKGLGSGDADFTLALLTGTDLGRRGHVDVNYGIGAIGAGSGRPHFVQNLLSVSASVSANERVNPYAEAFWFSRLETDGGATMAMDAGAIYRLSPRLAIDGGFQVGLTADAQDTVVFGGISVLVGASGDGVHQRHRETEKRPGRRAAPRRR